MRNVLSGCAALALCAVILIAGGPSPGNEPQKRANEPGEAGLGPTPPTTVKGYPRTDGSTSAEPLAMLVACQLTDTPWGWYRDPVGQRRRWPLKAEEPNVARSPAEALRLPDRKKIHSIYDKTRHCGTHGAYVRLIRGKVDLIFECRKPSEDEVKLMKQEGVEMDIRPIARDAFVFLKHKDNAVQTLSPEQIRAIYTGKIKTWKALGGGNVNISAYVRNRNSGSQETMESLVMHDGNMIAGRGMTGHTMAGPYNHLDHDRNGIGYTFFYYQKNMSPPFVRRGGTPIQYYKPVKNGKNGEAKGPPPSPVRMLAVGGVMPCQKTIAEGSYPFVTDVYVVTRKDLPGDHSAARLRDWLLTPAGQEVIAESGYVPLKKTSSELPPSAESGRVPHASAHRLRAADGIDLEARTRAGRY